MFRNMLRHFLLLLLLGAALPLLAQPRPKLEPLPEPPPPPPGASAEEPGEPSVRIRPGEDVQVEEHVIDGKRVVRSTTASGSVYYLIEDLGDGPGIRNGNLDSGVRVPLWVIRQF
jgi:hypothetical protein